MRAPRPRAVRWATQKPKTAPSGCMRMGGKLNQRGLILRYSLQKFAAKWVHAQVQVQPDCTLQHLQPQDTRKRTLGPLSNVLDFDPDGAE